MIIDQVFSLTKPSLMKPYKKKFVPPKEPLLVYSFDDAFDTDYYKAFPAMQARGIKGTSFVVPTWIGTPGYCTWEQLKEMKNSGIWDLQCHTTTHRYMAELTEAELHQEMQGVDQAFLDQGLDTPKHHAYPFGSTSDLVRSVFSEYRLTQRATGLDERHLNDYRTIVPSEIKGISVDAISQERLELAKRVITTGVNERKIIYLYNHRIVEVAGEYPYQTLESSFIELLDLIVSLGVETLTVSEMYDRVFVDA